MERNLKIYQQKGIILDKNKCMLAILLLMTGGINPYISFRD